MSLPRGAPDGVRLQIELNSPSLNPVGSKLYKTNGLDAQTTGHPI